MSKNSCLSLQRPSIHRRASGLAGALAVTLLLSAVFANPAHSVDGVIEINQARAAAGDVALDLNGFAILAQEVAEAGVEGFDRGNIMVANGTVRDAAVWGVLVGPNSRIEKIHGIGNSTAGAGANPQVAGGKNCRAAARSATGGAVRRPGQAARARRRPRPDCRST